jgi:hypothetical protein
VHDWISNFQMPGDTALLARGRDVQPELDDDYGPVVTAKWIADRQRQFDALTA